MFNLKEKISSIIKSETALYKQSMLDHDWGDSITLYDRQIVEAVCFENSIDFEYESDFYYAVLEYINENQDTCIDYREAGFPYASSDENAIASIGEIEIDIQHHFQAPITASKAECINRRTDLYISDTTGYQHGYINAGYDFIAVMINQVDVAQIQADLS